MAANCCHFCGVLPRLKGSSGSGAKWSAAKRILRPANDNEMPAQFSLISWPLFQ